MLKSTLLRWLLLSCMLAGASAVGLLCTASDVTMASALRNSIEDFVAPGVALWWLVLGGPFRVGPHSPSGIAFAAMSNAMFWLLAIALVTVVARKVYRVFTTARS